MLLAGRQIGRGLIWQTMMAGRAVLQATGGQYEAGLPGSQITLQLPVLWQVLTVYR